MGPHRRNGTVEVWGGDQADGGDREQRERTTPSLEHECSTGVMVPWSSKAGTIKAMPGLVDSDAVRNWQAGQSLPPSGPVSVWKKPMPSVTAAKARMTRIRRPVRRRELVVTPLYI